MLLKNEKIYDEYCIYLVSDDGNDEVGKTNGDKPMDREIFKVV